MDDREFYDASWRESLETGREDFGDIDQSIFFLNKVAILKRHHKILEIGCGIGKLTNYLYELGYHNIIGIDISEVAITYGRTHFPNISLHCMPADSIKFADEQFDICLSFDLIEHLPNVTGHFEEVLRVLKQNGKYLFQTPNILSNSIFETIKQKGFSWRCYHPSLQFSFNLRKKLLNAGFSKIEFINIPPISEYKLNKVPKLIGSLFKRVPWQYIPVLLQTNFWVVVHGRKIYY